MEKVCKGDRLEESSDFLFVSYRRLGVEEINTYSHPLPSYTILLEHPIAPNPTRSQRAQSTMCSS